MSVRSSNPSILALTCLALLTPLSSLGCEQKSRLAEVSDEDGKGEAGKGEAGKAEEDKAEAGKGEAGKGEAGKAEAGAPETPTPAVEDGPQLPRDALDIPIPATSGAARLIHPGAEERRVDLRLTLTEGTHYRVTTIGMLSLPLFDKPTGFAREEDLRLSECSGEGAARRCTLTHDYRNYDAEPPTGEGLERDEAAVVGLRTHHALDATGLRASETSIEGESEDQRGSKAGTALASAHRFYCIRFPEVAVGEGAMWADTCRMRQSGKIVTRELTWQVLRIEDSEDGARVAMQYAGTVSREGSSGKQTGQVKGSLLFFLDAGEPHLMRERLVFSLNPEKGLNTTTDLRFQFAKVVPTQEKKGAEDTLTRTDGKPYEQPAVVLNDPDAPPPPAKAAEAAKPN